MCTLHSLLDLVLSATGWSVWVHNILVREKDAEMKEDEEHLELGSLLKRKVRVSRVSGFSNAFPAICSGQNTCMAAISAADIAGRGPATARTLNHTSVHCHDVHW